MKNKTFYIFAIMVAMAICLVVMYCKQHSAGNKTYGYVKDSTTITIDTTYQGIEKDQINDN